MEKLQHPLSLLFDWRFKISKLLFFLKGSISFMLDVSEPKKVLTLHSILFNTSLCLQGAAFFFIGLLVLFLPHVFKERLCHKRIEEGGLL